MDRRKQFLDEFLGALGAREVRYLQITPESVVGTVVYDLNKPDEQQDFHWSLRESDAPSPSLIRLACLIRSHDLLSMDKLKVSREDLRVRFNAGQEPPYSPDRFSELLEEFLQIEVPMLDDGVEGDSYFIHE